jgi:uncharacterized protein YndB with AHSA1/START domain
MDGILERAGDRWRLRFERRLSHPPDKVWRALTEPEQLRAWFPDQIVVREWRAGSPLEFVSGFGDFDGEVIAVNPPHLLEFRWGTDILRFQVEPVGDGSLLTLTDTIDEIGKAARDGAGWHECLDRLEHALAGTTPEWAPGERYQAVHDRYVERFGPEAATIGPPSGSEETVSASS